MSVTNNGGGSAKPQTPHSELGADNSALRLHADDGTEQINTESEQMFLDWLEENGATFPKIEWPTRNTVGAVRGTVAKEDIAGGEKMLCVPLKLVMSPASASQSPTIGHVFRNPEAFRHLGGYGKYETSVFLMHERIKGEKSFWHPYIQALPEPRTVADWTQPELNELQHNTFCDQLPEHSKDTMDKYAQLFRHLRKLYPEEFPVEFYNYEAFRWAYLTVQARAFGRRLDWMALVPFADNLNHANVPVKYDYNEGNNGVFRLFPSPGSDGYRKGAEVFNSYGRRDNEHLLLHYGFALPDNEWDVFEVVLDTHKMFADRKARQDVRQDQRQQPASADGDAMMDGTEDDDPDVIAKALDMRIRRLAKFLGARAKFTFRDELFKWELLRLYRMVSCRTLQRFTF